jgi:DNA polymerase
MIVTLGRFSMARWFKNERISRIHGKAREDEGRVIVPLYHPAAALHQPSLRAVLEEDFRKLPLILDEFRSKRGEALDDAPAPAQMKLF